MFSFMAKGAFSVFALVMVVHLAGRLLDAGEQMQSIGDTTLAQACSSVAVKAAGVCSGMTQYLKQP
jgi:hypothetical protein